MHDLSFAHRHSYPADIPRYSDKYKPMAKKRPLLETAPLDQKFFPKEIWEDFFAAEKGMFQLNISSVEVINRFLCSRAGKEASIVKANQWRRLPQPRFRCSGERR